MLKSLFAIAIISPFVSTDAYATGGLAHCVVEGICDDAGTIRAPAALLMVAGQDEAHANFVEDEGDYTVRAPAAALLLAGQDEAKADIIGHEGDYTVRAPAAALLLAGQDEAHANFVVDEGDYTVRAPAAASASAPSEGVAPGSSLPSYLAGLLLSGLALVAGRRA